MTSITRLHADHQLDQLAAQFEHWRQHRSHPRERIPKPLWDQAVALTETLAPSRVATHLRLGVADLKKQMALRRNAPTQSEAVSVGFVEIPPVISSSDKGSRFEVEVQRQDGARLRLHAPDTALTAIMRSFLEA